MKSSSGRSRSSRVDRVWLGRKVQALDQRRSIEPLLKFVPTVTKTFEAPWHLKPYADKLEKFPHGGLETVLATPPQHGKTELTLHAIVWWLIKFPTLSFLYITYAQERADRVEMRARRVAQRAGLSFSKRKNLWMTPSGGSVIWTAFSGQITGEPVSGGVVIDDPYKNRREAESATNRQFLRDAMDDVINTRMHRGASALLMATRWTSHDLSGWLVKDRNWEYINLKAICDGLNLPPGDTRQPGEALWPLRKTVQELEGLRHRAPFTFSSMYQGEPRPREGTLFKEPTYYDQIPTERGYQVGYGIDLAYTESTSSDWSVCVRLVKVGPIYYVVGVWREQIESTAFKKIVRFRQREYRGKAYFYGSGTELGAVDSFRKAERDMTNPEIIHPGLDIRVMRASTDKRVRATPASEAWNAGRIQIPHLDPEPDWLHIFVEEITLFTGNKDPNDDQVDALAAVFDGMEAIMVDFDENYTDDLPPLRA